MKDTQTSAKSTPQSKRRSSGFTDEERGAMKDRVKEVKAAADKADGESDVLAKIAEMPKRDRAMAERLHAIIKASATTLRPRTWYGMPAYAKDGNVVLLLPKRAEVQDEVRDVRLQRPGAPRRRHPVADRLRSDEVDRRRRGKDRRAREESGELRTELDTGRLSTDLRLNGAVKEFEHKQEQRHPNQDDAGQLLTALTEFIAKS